MIRVTSRALSSASAAARRIPFKISEEVQQALNDKKKPVVSLESTIITHGLPYPNNLSMAQEVEQAIRDNGAIPATCAFIGGVPYIGLQPAQLSALAEIPANKGYVNKVSRRDIGYTMANKLNGGTTIALTMILSELAGIQVFATGGLGGVHKEAYQTFDVSADLTELGRTPVSVVCSGPKAILDIGLTLEYLETQGVFVGTYNEDSRPNIQVPGFYCRESGFKSPYSFETFKEMANVIYQHNNVMGLQSGNVICIPPPAESALSTSFINEIIERANEEAKALGISGKEVTPFLLSKIAKDTNGKSVDCNINFVINNAKAASKIATELLAIENRGKTQSSVSVPPPVFKKFPDMVKTLVIGSIAMDTISTVGATSKMNDSNPGRILSSTGGVGHNVSLACHYGLKSLGVDSGCRLVSIVSDDFSGKSIINQLEISGLDASGIMVSSSKEFSTAQYSSTHAANGELIIACADMKIVEEDFSKHILEQISRSNPQNVVIDCNLSPNVINKVLLHLRSAHVSTNVILEPTSHAKASRISTLESGIFPNNSITLATPTIAELDAIYSELDALGKFDDFDLWFPVLDSLGIDSVFREKLNAMSIKKGNEVLKELISKGVLQQAFQVLPFVPNLLVKLGDKGVVWISISSSVEDYNSIPTTSLYKPDFIVKSSGRKLEGGAKMGVVIQYFPIPIENRNLEIKNVTGAGDSLLGYLASTLNLGESNWLDSEIKSVEQEWNKWESIYKAQLASGLSLQSSASISTEIQYLK